MRKVLISLIALFLISCILFCNNTPQPDKKHTIYQIPGCNDDISKEAGVLEEYFSYSFDETTLSIDFSVIGNCCPDSNRFDLSYNLQDNSITIFVEDTAANLCKCDCNYLIHADFYELDQYKYVVTCIRKYNAGKDSILYKETVYKPTELEVFHGYLFSKLHLIGSFSEGPTYYLQKFGYKEIPIQKHTHLWERDPKLHKFLGEKVTIAGEIKEGKIYYVKIEGPSESPDQNNLEVVLKFSADTLWVNKMPPGTNPPQTLDLTLLVKWPYRSVWRGECPTTQLYDFSIEYKENTIWKWSDGHVFDEVNTPISIPGGNVYEFKETWKINPDDIEFEGTYTAKVIFIASGQEVVQKFTIKFIQ